VNSLDLVIVVIVLISLLHSLFRGFIKEVCTLVSMVLGFLAACHSYHQAADLLRPLMETEALRNILGFCIVFLICSVVVSLLGKLVQRLAKEARLGWLDHLCGLGIGLLKGVIFVGILLMVLVSFLPPKTRITSESRLAPQVISVTKAIVAVTPKTLREQFDSRLGELTKMWSLREVDNPLRDILPGRLPSRAQPKKP